jgi:peptide/nickel transport system substrate-binding protein
MPNVPENAESSPGLLSRRGMLSGMAGLAAIGGLSLAGCSSSSKSPKTSAPAAAAAIKKGGTLTIAVKTEPQGYNPLVFINGDARWLTGQIVDSLYDYDDSGAIVNNLAASAPTSTDGKTWTLTVKSGISFHNGEAFTAADVAATLEAITKSPTNAYSAQIGTITSVKATSATEVTFTLAGANYVIPQILTLVPMVNKNHTADMTGIIGTGPFKWTTLVSGSHLSLTANPSYHLGAPELAGVTFNYVPDPDTRAVDLLQKTADFIMIPSFADLARLSSSSGVTVLDQPAVVMLPLHVNVNSVALKDPRVRQALGFAMDRTQVRDVVFAGKAQLQQSGALAPDMRGFDPNDKFYPATADPAKARALLKEAGLSSVSFKVAVYNTAESVNAMQVIQQNWAAAGLHAELETMDLASFGGLLTSKKFDIAVSYEYNGTWWGNEGVNQLSNYMTGAFANWVNYSNPEYDALLAKSRATSNTAEQTQMWQQLNHMLAEAGVNLLPVVPNLTGATLSMVEDVSLPAFSRSFIDLRKTGLS